MSLLGLLCLLLAIAATLLGVLYWMQRRELAGVQSVSEQLERLLAQSGTPSGRVYLQSEEPRLQELTQVLNRLLVRVSDRGERTEVAPSQGAALFATLADRSHEAVIVHRDGILFANRHFATLVGVEREQLIGRPLAELVDPEFSDLVATSLRRRLADEYAPERFEVEMVGFQAQISRLELTVRRVDWGGAPALLITGVEIVQTSTVRALTEPTYAQHLAATGVFASLQSPADGSIALDCLPDAVVTTDVQGDIVHMNPAAERLLQVSRADARGRPLSAVVAVTDDADRRTLLDPVQQALTGTAAVYLGRRAVALRRTDQDDRVVEVSAAPLRRDAAADSAGTVVLLHDVTELRSTARQLSYQATHDALTGLVNRREFERRLEDALDTARRGDSTHILCYLDLDRFKQVNDSSGHQAGDRLLRDIARLLREAVRDSDTVARLGGDEFALLLIGCPLDKARQIADDVCRRVAEHRFVWKDRIFDVGVSVGIIELARESGSVEDVLAAADSACYVAKKQGTGNVSIYSARDEAAARSSGEIQWLQQLQAAIRGNRFELATQSIVPVSPATRGGPAMEVFVRMRDDAGGELPPRDFVRAAERYRLMGTIDRWVVQHTLDVIASGSLPVPSGRCVAVNISAQTLADTQFLEFVVDSFDRTGVAPAQICFELSETTVVANIEHARRFAGVLHGMGCRFALDDFGSGVGSFSNLKNLPLDYLKIDGAFTRNLGADSVNQAMVAAMVQLARTLNFQVIAEQVEDTAALDAARRLGVDFIQGYVISRPQPLPLAA
jgi:diguanylate cyclase (GGDEF)-like protein/PAS domain S-box-containing protein